MNYSTRELDMPENVSNYLSPGIVEATIQSLEYFQSSGGTEGIKITLVGDSPTTNYVHPEGYSGPICQTTWWMSEKAWPYTGQRLAYLGKQLLDNGREPVDYITENSSSASEIATQLNTLFANQRGRFVLNGKEVQNANTGRTFIKAEIAGFNFVERTDVTESKLRWSEEKNVIRLETPSEEPVAAGDAPW